MKTILSLVAVVFVSLAVNAQDFKFVNETVDYGKIKQGADGKRAFEFTNVGKEPLKITKVQPACGCTIPQDYSKMVMPGEKGKISFSYDTKRPGVFSKAITIYSNAKKGTKILKIKGFVGK